MEFLSESSYDIPLFTFHYFILSHNLFYSSALISNCLVHVIIAYAKELDNIDDNHVYNFVSNYKIDRKTYDLSYITIVAMSIS